MRLMKDIAQAVLAQNNQQAKYIRTFDSDVQTLKEGGTPELAPFREAEETATPVEPVPVLRMASVEPTFESTLLEKESTLQPPINILSLPKEPQAAMEKPTAVPALLVPPTSLLASEPSLPPVREPELTPIKTYGGDFQDRMDDLHASPMTVLAAEQDARPAPSAAPEEFVLPQEKTNWWPIVIGGFLLIAGGGAVFAAYVQYRATSAPVIVAPSMTAPIFFDTSEKVSGTGVKLAQAIVASKGEPLPRGTVRLLSLGENATTSVFAELALRAPGLLTRNIEKTGGMAGIVNTGTEQSPFFILIADSYSTTFSGMLSWEARMPNDMALLFPAYEGSLVATSTVVAAPARLAGSVPTPRPSFRDEVIANHDARVYRDEAGRSVLLYGYWDETTLIIARDSAAFAALLDRLATSHAH